MKIIKNIALTILGLFIAYLAISFLWSILNMQSCSYNLSKNATCEEIAENEAENCHYIILRWKKVDYNKALEECLNWESKQK